MPRIPSSAPPHPAHQAARLCRDYVALCNAMSNGDGKGWATRVSTEEELIAALNTATSEKADQ